LLAVAWHAKWGGGGTGIFGREIAHANVKFLKDRCLSVIRIDAVRLPMLREDCALECRDTIAVVEEDNGESKRTSRLMHSSNIPDTNLC
jgi:hypothetical protein